MSWRRRAAEARHRHYGDVVQFLATVPLVVVLLTVPEGPVRLWAAVAGTVLLVIATVMQIRHRTGPLCEECIKAMPLNAAEEVEQQRRWRWSLSAFHIAFDGPLRRQVSGAVSVAALLLGMEPAYRLVGVDNAHLVSSLFLSIGSLVSASYTWLIRTHNRFQPWCPHCDHGGGRGGRDLLVPEPDDDHGRPLPV